MLKRTLIRMLAPALVFGMLIGCASPPTSGLYFDEQNAQEIQVGMSEGAVRELLGSPYLIESYIGGEKWIWSYSTRDIDSSFVVTIENEKVESISNYYEVKR